MDQKENIVFDLWVNLKEFHSVRSVIIINLRWINSNINQWG